MKRIQIITGHYGSGKTEFAVNWAISLARQGVQNVTLADLDIVNPYFRSYEQTERMEKEGVNTIVTSCGGVADIPAINPAVLSIFQNKELHGVLDIGGDPIGARVLARLSPSSRDRTLTSSSCSTPTAPKLLRLKRPSPISRVSKENASRR